MSKKGMEPSPFCSSVVNCTHLPHCTSHCRTITTEEQKEDGSMPFLDILVTPQEDLPIQINICNGIATTIWPASTV